MQVWEQVSEDQVVVQGYGKRFVERFVKDPNTEETKDFFLYGRRNGSIVFPLTEDGRVVVVRQFRPGVMKVTHELPAGGSGDGEQFVQTARRELWEETGYEPGSGPEDLFPTCNGVWLDATNSWVEDQTSLALNCKYVGKVEDPNEQIEVILMSLEEWLTLFREEHMDSGSVAATAYALPHLLLRGLVTADTFK